MTMLTLFELLKPIKTDRKSIVVSGSLDITSGSRLKWPFMPKQGPKSIGTHGCPWISMDIHGYPWISMDIRGYPWISMDIHGYPWISMDIHGYQWILDLVSA